MRATQKTGLVIVEQKCQNRSGETEREKGRRREKEVCRGKGGTVWFRERENAGVAPLCKREINKLERPIKSVPAVTTNSLPFTRIHLFSLFLLFLFTRSQPRLGREFEKRKKNNAGAVTSVTRRTPLLGRSWMHDQTPSASAILFRLRIFHPLYTLTYAKSAAANSPREFFLINRSFLPFSSFREKWETLFTNLFHASQIRVGLFKKIRHGICKFYSAIFKSNKTDQIERQQRSNVIVSYCWKYQSII